jgi:hypothetical protein
MPLPSEEGKKRERTQVQVIGGQAHILLSRAGTTEGYLAPHCLVRPISLALFLLSTGLVRPSLIGSPTCPNHTQPAVCLLPIGALTLTLLTRTLTLALPCPFKLNGSVKSIS